MSHFLSASRSTLDLTGQTFGMWKVIRSAPRITSTNRWLCRHLCCEVGGEAYLETGRLRGKKAPKYCGVCRPKAGVR